MSEVFLEVLNVSIMAGWAVLAVLILRQLLKKAPAWIRCALWAVVGLRLIWPFHLESILSLIPSTQTLPAHELYNYMPELQTGVTVLDNAINPAFTETFQSEMANSVNPLQVVTFICGWVWLLGTAVMAAYAIVSYLRLQRQVAASLKVQENVYLCDQVQTPFTLGITKPKIYLPSNLPEEKWGGILAHERAHLARRDHWWKPLGFALLAVHWFNPMLWLAYILLCRDMEQACDERVIREMTTEEKKEYSQTLLECSVSTTRLSACPLAFGETGVKQRIKAVLHYKKPTLWLIIVAVVLCGIVAVCFLTEPSDAYWSVEHLREEYPQYFELSDFKGIEVYVWEENGKLYCGAMEGTNRTKTEDEIRALEPVSLSAMKKILSTLDSPQNYIFVGVFGESRYWTGNITYPRSTTDYLSEEGYAEICRQLGLVGVQVDSTLFSANNGERLYTTVYGTSYVYIKTTEAVENYEKAVCLNEFSTYENQITTTYKIYAVQGDLNYRTLIVTSRETGTEDTVQWVFKQEDRIENYEVNGIHDLRASKWDDETVMLIFNYTMLSGSYSVKTVPRSAGEYTGDGEIPYDGALGEYRVMIEFSDTGYTDDFAKKFPVGQMCRLRNVSDSFLGEVKVKVVHPSDHGFVIYVGSDVPFAVEEKIVQVDDVKGLMGRIMIAINK